MKSRSENASSVRRSDGLVRWRARTLDRLLRNAAGPSDDAPIEMPFGFDSRVIALSRRNGNGAAFGLLLRRVAAIAAAVIGGTSLSGGVGRMTGTVIGAVILGILTSGFTFLNVDAHYQEIIKGGVIVAAVVADQYRQRRRKGA